MQSHAFCIFGVFLQQSRLCKTTIAQPPVACVLLRFYIICLSPDFFQLDLPDAILRAVTELGYETPSPIQAAAIPKLLAGEELIGSGANRYW